MLCSYNWIKQTGRRKSQQYLHPWNNLLQNVVQTSSPLWQAQRPAETAQSHHKHRKRYAKGTHLLPPLATHSHNATEVFFWVHFSSQVLIQCYSWLSVQSLTMQAVLHRSAGVLYPEPMSTSKDRYCRVWMSSVKCLCWEREIEEKKPESMTRFCPFMMGEIRIFKT